MMFRQGKGAKPIDGEWHEQRAEARREAFSVKEFSPQDITRWDLDTARITGRENPRTYQIDTRINSPGTVKPGTDIREFDRR